MAIRSTIRALIDCTRGSVSLSRAARSTASGSICGAGGGGVAGLGAGGAIAGAAVFAAVGAAGAGAGVVGAGFDAAAGFAGVAGSAQTRTWQMTARTQVTRGVKMGLVFMFFGKYGICQRIGVLKSEKRIV